MTEMTDWYFDFVSPFPYLQLAQFDDEMRKTIRPRPILFAALLNHWGHKGPAEIPTKARHTYYLTHWIAKTRGVPFAGPPRHPFNPIAVLRLALSLNATFDVIETIYRHIWGEGHDGQSEESLAILSDKLGVNDVAARTSDPEIKSELRRSTDEAISRGVFGVPTLFVDDHLFWGDDATDMYRAFRRDPKLFQAPEFKRLKTLEPAAVRRRSAIS